MEQTFKSIEQTRLNFLGVLSGLSIEEVNKIPANFNNNLVWHLGHIIAAQQVLTYKLSGLDTRADMNVFSKYSKGTKPEGLVEEQEYDLFKALLTDTFDQLKADYATGMFKTYTEYTTSYGIILNSIETAIPFVALHEALHLGYIMALKRAIH